MAAGRQMVGAGVLVAAVVGMAHAGSARAARPVACESLRELSLPHTRIFTAEVISGAFQPSRGTRMTGLPAVCRIVSSLTPTPDSDIRVEVWLPMTGWNRRLQGIGNGGFAGAIDYGALREAVVYGYAAAATDTGHDGTAIDATWALGHPEKVVDFGYRAVHEMTGTAKAMASAFYGGDPRHAYFASCSNGGRQALMEAQRYPADYDGIIAGAPANDWTRLMVASLRDWQLASDPSSRIVPAKLAAIENASLAACDADDGVKDGVIDNPARCRFDPAVLACKGAETDACLTTGQVDALEQLYAGTRSSSGRQLFPGHPVGGITGGGGWSTWVTGSATSSASIGAQFGLGFFTNFLAHPPSARDLLIDRESNAADDAFAAILNATDPNLSPFARRGGKLIVYHGWSDPAISAYSSIDYRDRMIATMGATRAASFSRLFLVPGMQHCIGGPGPDMFGQAGPSDAGRDQSLDAALVAWVEQGSAPERVIATRYRSGENPASGVLRTRPLCAYPQVAQWKGAGSTDEAASFTCVTPPPAKR